MRRSLIWLGGALLLPALGAWAAQDEEPPPVVVETLECRTCHEDSLGRSDRTHHAGLDGACIPCHEGALEHQKGQMEGENVPGPSIKSMEPADASQICLECHETSHNPTWVGSAHANRGVGCVDCHSVHSFESKTNQLHSAHEPETCYSCHPAMRAMGMRTSHHPVREGLMTCGDCHNPHDGSRPKMIRADWTNELCYECHAEKRGPFLWEHAPVREDCLNCHNPHGSNHDKLLVAKMPYLCQRCHLNTRHPGTLYDGANFGTTTPGTASNRAIEHSCKNCHQAVHGSNAPSGPYLGR